jgi:hypothetical protein
MQKIVAALGCLSLVILVNLSSCVSHDFPDYVCDEGYTFSDDIRPIIETKCALSGCHNGDMGSDLNWNDFGEFHERAESGEVKSRVTSRIMPPSDSPGGPLTQAQIDAIVCWSDQGALNN